MVAKLRSRSRNLDDQSIERIVEILDGWSSPKLTWELLIEQILLRLRAKYTRQALNNHMRIKETFVARKKAIRDPSALKLISQTPEQQRIARLEAENERLKRENNNLLEQFNRWAYNGYLRQMDERMLDFMSQPLPSVHRDASKQPFKSSKEKE
ncbi:hypothetical protein D3C76_452200 [compost metagenome]